MRLIPSLLSTLLAAAPAPSAGAASARRVAAPEVKVQGHRIVLERLIQMQNLGVDFPDGAVPPDPGKPHVTEGLVNGRQQLTLFLAVYPPAPQQAANVQGLDARILGFPGHGAPVTFRSLPPDDSNPLRTGVWRTQLMASDVDLSVSRLQRVAGELIVYPAARLVHLDFPLPAKFPQTRDSGGFRVTLRSGRSRSGTLSFNVETQWPATLSVSRPSPEVPAGITAITRAGSTLVPGGGASMAAERGGWSVRQYSVTFTDLKEPPARIRVSALVRSGTPKRLPFSLGPVSMPDAEAAEGEPQDAQEGTVALAEGQPLFAKQGGAIQAAVRRPPRVEGGRLLIALSRREGAAFGPWRWIEAPLDRDGRVTLTHLRPGAYRVSREWEPSGAGGASGGVAARPGTAILVDVAAGKTASLPVLDAGVPR